MANRAATDREKAYLRTPGKWSELCLAGLENPPTVLAARVNQTFATKDKIASVAFDNVSNGSWEDVISGMDLWVGSAAGLRDIGEIRVRSATATELAIGEESDIDWADELHLTVKDTMGLWPKHVRIAGNTVYMDHSIVYSDQHEDFDPVVVMGSDAVADLTTIDLTELVGNGTFPINTVGWTAGSGVLLSVVSGAMHIDRNGAGLIDHAWQDITTVVGMVYAFSVNIVSFSHGYEVYVGGVLKFNTAHSTGVKSVVFTATSTTTRIMFRVLDDANATLNVDDVSVKSSSILINLDSSESYVYDSTISSRLWETTFGVLTGPTTVSPALAISQYPTGGKIRLSLTETSAAGKSFTGYRYIYVYDTSHRPENNFVIGEPTIDEESGGWSCEVTMLDNVDIANVRDRAKIILFGRKEYYGNTQISIGQQAGRENVIIECYVDGETIDTNIPYGSVKFTVKGPQFWLGKMTGFPPGVKMGIGDWTKIPALTVDRAVWHLLHWRCTATAVMDVVLTGDTRYSKGFVVPAQSIWEQIKEIAGTSIYARPGCDRYGRLYLEVEPQLVPVAERTWATVMNITKEDYQGKIVMLCKCDVSENAMLAQSGVAVDSSGNGTPLYSLSPGHVFKRYGSPEVNDRLLLADQAQANTLAGAMAGWKNNNYPSFEIKMAANNRMIDIFPRSFCSITIAAEDTIRGRAYSGNLIPRSITLEFNNGYLIPTINFEGESFPALAVNGDPPVDTTDCGEVSCPKGYHLDENNCCVQDDDNGCGDTTCPAGWHMGIDHCCVPDDIDPPDGDPGAKVVVMLLSLYGVAYTENADALDPDDVHWSYYNEGLSSTDLEHASDLFLTNDGHVYVIGYDAGYEYIAVAPSLGEPFVKIIDAAFISSTYSYVYSRALNGFAINPNKDNEYAFAAGGSIVNPPTNGQYITDLYIDSLTPNPITGDTIFGFGALTYGFGHWTLTGVQEGGGAFTRYTALRIFVDTGGSIDPGVGASGIGSLHWRLNDGITCLVWVVGSHTYKFTGDGSNIAQWTLDIYGSGDAARARVASDPTGITVMVGGTPTGESGGLWLSTDGGETWVLRDNGGLLNFTTAVANGNSALCWVAGIEQTDVYLTLDAGATAWTNISGDMRAGGASYKYPISAIKQIRVKKNDTSPK